MLGVLTFTFHVKCSLNDDIQVAEKIAPEFSKMMATWISSQRGIVLNFVAEKFYPTCDFYDARSYPSG